MNKLAAIYIRTSSEHQAEKASPEEQERDCRSLAEQHGLKVTAVYRDTERYRVGRRLVDPSGTRADRPGLAAMLSDAMAGKFDVILAWKEDRLYRGLRAMLSVLEVLQEKNLNVLLAKESFDPTMAPVKVWVAGMDCQLGQLSMQEVYLKQELANLHQRFDIALLADWEQAAYKFLDNLREKIGTLKEKPETGEEKKLQFEIKRQVVLAIVERVEIKKDRKMDVICKLDVLSFLAGRGRNDNTPNNGV
jgi:hypothetical protein